MNMSVEQAEEHWGQLVPIEAQTKAFMIDKIREVFPPSGEMLAGGVSVVGLSLAASAIDAAIKGLENHGKTYANLADLILATIDEEDNLAALIERLRAARRKVGS